jgi:hypothetical protein
MSEMPGKMIQGYIPCLGVFASSISTWVDKEHLTKQRGTNVKVDVDKCVPIAALRCSSCGYLEFYARSEFAPG